MLYVIYHTKTTDILKARGQHVGCYVSDYKSASAAKAALTRLDKKGLLGFEYARDAKGNRIYNTAIHEYKTIPYVKSDFAICDTTTFANDVELMVERVNIMSGETYMEAKNTSDSCSPATERYWSM
jgi:hypothetical protein